MRNKYPGTCYRCGLPVAPGEGHFELISNAKREKWCTNAKWLLQHARCAILFRGTDTHYLWNPIEKDNPDGEP